MISKAKLVLKNQILYLESNSNIKREGALHEPKPRFRRSFSLLFCWDGRVTVESSVTIKAVDRHLIQSAELGELIGSIQNNLNVE